MPRSSRYKKGGPLREHGGIMSYDLDMQADVFTLKQARAEYARLRREANRRLETLRRSEFAKLPSVANRSDPYAALPAGAPEQLVRKQLYDVARFLNLRTSSVQGAKRAMRDWTEAMQGQGFDFVNKSNAIDFARFMGHVQERYGKKAYSSEQIGRMYKAARDKRVDPETIKNDFDWWILHVDDLESEKRSNETISGEAMAERMGLTID